MFAAGILIGWRKLKKILSQSLYNCSHKLKAIIKLKYLPHLCTMIETPFCKANEYVRITIEQKIYVLVSQAFLSFEKKPRTRRTPGLGTFHIFLTNENYVLISSKMAEIT